MLAKTWPNEHVNPSLVMAAHIYLLSWDAYTDSERKSLFAKLSAWPNHIGLTTAPFATAAGVNQHRPAKRNKTGKYMDIDTATAYIERAVGEQPVIRRDKVRAALWLMYTCGISTTALVNLRGDSFATVDGNMLLLTQNYIYVLTPTVRQLVADWLAACPTPDRPFNRLYGPLQPYVELAEAYDVAQSN